MKIVIVGSSIAAYSVIKNLRNNGFNKRITCITRDRIPFYSRIPLPDIIAGEKEVEDIVFHSEEKQRIEPLDLIIGQSVTAVDTNGKQLYLQNNRRIEYDNLVICTGASAKEPPSQIMVPGVFTLRNIEDALGIREYAKNADTAAIVGGGLVGLKSATALMKKGLKAKLIIKSPRILSRNVDDNAAALLQDVLRDNGLETFSGLDVAAVRQKDNRLSEMVLDNGEAHKCEMLIYGKGVSPNLEFLDGSGIICERGIVANRNMMTNIKDVYTAGDVACAPDFFTGNLASIPIWPEAVRQGQVVAKTILGIKDEYEGSIPMNIMELCGISFASIGITTEKKDDESIIKYHPERGIYKKAILRKERLIGVVLVGDIAMAGIYYTLIKKKTPILSPKDLFLPPYKVMYGDAVRRREAKYWV